MTKTEKIKYDQLLNENLELKRQNQQYKSDLEDFVCFLAPVVADVKSGAKGVNKHWLGKLVKLYHEKVL